jgi:hypothetical protein
MVTRVHLNKKYKFIKKKKINLFFFYKKNRNKKKKRKKKRQAKGWPNATPGHPPSGGPATLWPAFFCFKKISLFIYVLITLYFFIKMDMCRQ